MLVGCWPDEPLPDDPRTRAATLLPDRDAAIVTYCSNRACPNSGRRPPRAARYTNIRTS